MDKIAEAIKTQYRRRQNAIENRDRDTQVLWDNMHGKIDGDLFFALREEIYRCYKPIIDDANRSIKILEELRDE